MHLKQTKIIATVSDRRCEPEFINELYKAGVNVVRLNTAHQTPEVTLGVIKNVRAVSDRIALLLDTKGPEVRTTGIDGKVILDQGQQIKLVKSGGGADSFSVSYPDLIDELSVGDDILIDDGSTHLQVIVKEEDHLLLKSIDGGEIGNKKSVNVPGVHLSLPSLTDKDREYIKFAAENDIDFVAHSFVRNKEDVLAVQDILDKNNGKSKIVAKIENREGVENLDEILDHAYGIMIARGDLGIEIPAEEVPLIQKQMIDRCITRAHPVITATQMLHTMIDNARPTRAEVSDVANAVLDGTDALMLSGETAYGKYPIESVNAMVKIASAAEVQRGDVRDHPFHDNDHALSNYLGRTAVRAALDMDAKVIISDTSSGYSSRVVSSFRGKIPICATTHDQSVVRLLALSYGVFPFYTEPAENTDIMVNNAITILLEKNMISENDLVLILASTPEKSSGSNIIEFNTPRDCLLGKSLVKCNNCP